MNNELLDYFDNTKFTNYENQTNYTLCCIMNNFIAKYKKDFNNKIFILEYNDDIYSTIAYRILKNLQGVFNFNLKVKGSCKIYEKEINKKDKISIIDRIVNRKKNRIFISCYNPIYDVISSNATHIKTNSEKFFIINRFTKEQFKIMCKFFCVKDIRGELNE